MKRNATCIDHGTTDVGKTDGVKKETEGVDKSTTDGIRTSSPDKGTNEC